MILCGIPYLAAMFHKESLWMQSKALLKSIKFIKTGFCHAKHLSTICLNMKICSQQERPFRNPAWLGRSITSMDDLILLSKTVAITFPGMESKDIPVHFVQCVRSPFFGKGCIMPAHKSNSESRRTVARVQPMSSKIESGSGLESSWTCSSCVDKDIYAFCFT